MIRKSAFVICPLGLPGSVTRQRSDLLLELVIRPVLIPLHYDVARADLAADRPTIPDTISQHIFEDDLVVADLTDANPNVFYELGKRHAINAACVHLTTDVRTLPFDLRHYRALEYDLSIPSKIDDLRRELRVAITYVEDCPPTPPFAFTPEDVIRLSGHTVVVNTASGRDDPYSVSTRIAEGDCRIMLLMQRSSSLLLGPEQGWGEEERFYRTVMRRIGEGVELLHMVSLDGIVRHLKRPDSTFPGIQEALGRLVDERGIVALAGKRPMYVKTLRDTISGDIKPDRQARVFLVEHSDGMTEGNFVIDIGSTQCSFHLRGPEVQRFMRRALEFYHNQCDYLRWSELNAALAPYTASPESNLPT